MSKFVISQMQDASVLAMHDIKKTIQIDPVYQRVGGVWSLKKQQLFLDSLLNRYDIPKFYLHNLTTQKGSKFDYAIIDGRQRLEAIWGFMEGNFALGRDFEYFDDPAVKAAGMTYKEIANEYPRLLTRLHSRTLSVVLITADELDFIEDMFSRLNEAVPLNAAEKRNALGGPIPLVLRELVQHKFFRQTISISDSRYRHHDVAVKLLYLEDSEEIVDTKRASLDLFVKGNAEKTPLEIDPIRKRTQKILDALSSVFTDKDQLLTSSGMVVVYYVLFSKAVKEGKAARIKRKSLVDFEELRQENRELFAKEDKRVNLKLIEFDELAQSSNDGAAIRQRYEMLREHLKF